jgi:hypothetical protein
MSTIAAGTTSGTALVNTGDTTGALVLQTNGTTTAVTIGTNQVVTLAQPLPVASGGTGATSLSGITVGTATSATTATTATNIAGGSNGTIPYQSAAGTTQMLAVGSAGQVLQTNGAGAPTWVTPGGGSMIFLSTVTATNAATADVETTFNSTYDNYVIMATGVTGDLDNRTKIMRVKVGGTYQTASYRSTLWSLSYTSGAGTVSATSDGFILLESHYASTYPLERADFIVYIRRPSDATNYKTVNYQSSGFGASTSSSNNATSAVGGGSWTGSTGAITGVQFLCSAGNITGTFRLYGIKNS